MRKADDNTPLQHSSTAQPPNAPSGRSPQSCSPSAAGLFFQISLGLLTLLTLAILVAEEAVTLPQELGKVVQGFDLAVCIIFFGDFCYRAARAPSPRKFWKWGWIDLIACIPNLDILRFGRLVRLLRIIRIVRTIRTTHRLISLLLQRRTENALVLIFLTIFLVVAFASGSILVAESQIPDANITTAQDALWWSITTITTVGYGDRYPLTSEGRLIAVVLMVCGVGLFGTFSGLIATWLLGSNAEENAPNPDVIALTAEVKQLREQLQFLLSTQPSLIERPNTPASPPN